MRLAPFTISAALTAATIIFFTTPLTLHAQTDASLETTIRAALLSDERSAALPSDQLDSLVATLSAAAQERGLTSQDILWRPEQIIPVEYSVPEEVSVQGCPPGLNLCTLNEAFGFSGGDMTIPVWFGITSALLILIIGALMEVHHVRAKAAVAAPESAPVLETQKPKRAPAKKAATATKEATV